MNTEVYDEVIRITNEDAFKFGRLLCAREGVFAGISSGAALAAAVQIAHRNENTGKTIVTIFPDSGSRYLSTPLFSEQ